MDTTFNETAITPKLGKVKPIDIFSLDRRKINEKTVTDLVEDLARHGGFLHPITVRDEGATGYRLIAGQNRLQAWKRHFGDRQPIDAMIYPSHTPDALITDLDAGENLDRQELTAAERQAQMLRRAAALKEREDEKLATKLPVSGSDAGSATRGGRGKTAATAKVAARLGVSKTTVQNWTKDASDAIGETIDLDHDTPEELKRKADKLQQAELKIEPKRIRVKRPTSPAKPEATEADSKFEVARKAYDALDSADKFQFVYYACLQIGLDALKMAPPAGFGLADEGPELDENAPAAVAPATDDAAVVQAEPGDDGADLGAEDLQVADGDGSEDTADDAADAADQENLGAEDLEDAGDAVLEAAGQEPASANLHAEHLQDASVDGCEAPDQEPDGATRCAYCSMEFYSSDERVMIYGRLYHADLCAKYAKPPIAIAA
jgi:ParB-like nuclease domain